MKKTFTKGIFIALTAIFCLAMAFPASAQFTSKLLKTNTKATVAAVDVHGNVYVIHNPLNGSTGELLKYTGGVGSPTVVYNGSLLVDIDVDGDTDDYPYGLAVASNGDIYFSTSNDYAQNLYGDIVKIPAIGGGSSYGTAAIFKAGTAAIGGFASLAIDASDILYAVQYDTGANGGASTNGIPGAYEVVRYSPGSSTTFTRIFDKLEINAFNSPHQYTAITGLAVDAAGNVYVADNFDANAPQTDGGTVYKFTASSGYSKSTVSTGTHARALATDAAGNLYATVDNTLPAYQVVKYTNGAGAPTAVYGPLGTDGVYYPTGLAVLNASTIFVTNGENGNTGGVGNLLELFGAPSTQASNVTFSNIAATTATINWTNGDGTSRAVFIKNANTGQPTPVNGTTYGANPAFGSGIQIGATGWYCVFNSTAGSSIGVTGLTAGQNYQVMVVEYNGTIGAEDYLQSTGTNNPATFTAVTPVTIASLNRVNGPITNLATVNYALVFSAAVTGVASTNFALQAGSIADASIGTPTSVDNITWNIPVTTGTTDGTIQLNVVNSTGFSKPLGTGLPFAGQQYTIDKTAPTVSFSAPTVAVANSSTTVSYTVTYTDAHFSSAGVAPIDVFLNTTFTGSANLNSLTVHPLVGNTQVIDFNVNGDGTVAFKIPAGTATDAAGNTSALSALSPSFIVDNTAPTLAINRTDPNPIKDNVLDFQVIFNEAVTGVDPTDFTMTNSGVTTGAISLSPVNATTYNITVAGVSGTGTARLDLNGAGTGIIDAAGNAPAGFTGGQVYNVDQTAPTINSITATTPTNANPTNATSVIYTATFSEAVTGVDADDFTFTTISGNAAGSVTGVSSSDGGVTYAVTVSSVSGNGSFRLDLNTSGTGIVDVAGNPIAGGLQGDSYAIDNTPATLTSGSYFSNNGFSSQYAKVGDNITLTIGFNEVLQSCAITINGIAVSSTPSNGNRNWTAILTTSSTDNEGNVPWTINAVDLAGNVRAYTNNDFGTFLSFDRTNPVPVISAPSAPLANPGGADVTYTVNYTDANFNFSTLSTSDITLIPTGTANGTISNVSNSGSTSTVTISGITGFGTLGISIGANTAQDIPGNLADASAPSQTFNVALSNAVLTKLAVNPPIHMSQVTGPDFRDYTSRVGNSVSSITLTPISVGDNSMTVTVNGTSVALGTPSAAIPLNVGTTVITTVVTAQDGITQNTYKLTVTRIAESALASLSTNPRVALRTATGPNFMDYTASVMNSVNSIAIIPTTPDVTNTIQVNGVTVASGAQSAAIPLTVGDNTITTIVTDGSTSNTYSLVVTRKGPELSSLAISPNTTLKTVTGPDFKDYTASVVNSVSSVVITPTALDPTSTIAVNGTAVTSGSASMPIALNTGLNTINTVVTSQDGTVAYTYSIKITRQAPSILARLTVNPSVSLSAVTGPDFKDYTARVGSSISSVTITPIAIDPTNSIQVNGTAVASGATSDLIALNVGDNTITTIVTDGVTTNTYSVKITRLAPAILTSLTLNPKLPIKTVTGPDFKDYAVTADNSISSVTLTPTAGDASNLIQVNGMTVASGTASADLPLNVGDNTITTTVTSGEITNVYSMTITRLAPIGAMMAYQPANDASVDPVPVAVHQNISPNGDGNGDHLQIDGIDTYPDNKLQIMSRSGELVYEVKGYDNQNKVFDGHSNNGKLQQAGTYFYSLEYKSGKETKHKTGYFVLKY